MSILQVTGLKKIYTTRFGGNKVEALKNVNFTVEQGEYVAIMGESGSGKTTLLNILAALDKPTSGSVILDGQNLSQIKETQIAAFRRDNLGQAMQTGCCLSKTEKYFTKSTVEILQMNSCIRKYLTHLRCWRQVVIYDENAYLS